MDLAKKGGGERESYYIYQVCMVTMAIKKQWMSTAVVCGCGIIPFPVFSFKITSVRIKT
jgi:hypothetical protein